MMRLILGLAVLVGIMAGVAFGLPAHVTVTRSQKIAAPESVVFPYLNNLHEFSEWSPWQLRDPQLKVTYGGPQQGKGAQVTWTSEKPSIGTGSMEIVESDPNRNIDLAVNFNGLEGIGSYKLVPDGSGSKVTWSFVYESGSSPLKRWKALMLDGFVGSEYSAGLERLKQKVEAERRPTTPTVPLTPEGMPLVPGQPGAALPPGAAPGQGGTTVVPEGAALPPGQTPPADGTTPTGATQQDAGAPAAAEVAPPEPAPTPAPAPAPKKKKKRQ
jgi:hypothetical protein